MTDFESRFSDNAVPGPVASKDGRLSDEEYKKLVERWTK
jgi:hypothetical protein